MRWAKGVVVELSSLWRSLVYQSHLPLQLCAKICGSGRLGPTRRKRASKLQTHGRRSVEAARSSVDNSNSLVFAPRSRPIMAPATRSRQAVGVKKAPPARKSRATRSTAKDTADEWTFEEDQHQHQQTEHDSPEMEHHYNGSLVVDSRETVDMDFDDADHPMDPIREMAERVGREAEAFAENLDRLLASLATRNKYEAVMDVVEEFKSIARDAAFALRKNHERERAQRLRKEWSEQANIPSQTLQFGASKDALALSTTDENRDPVTQMRKWQQEADLWELFSLVLELHHNPDRNTVQRENEEKIEALGEVHRYSSEDSLWNRFLLQDDLARERALVKKWLERTAEHQTSDLHNIMEELEAKAGRGKGLWSEGWLHTREKIKGEKRLRSWPTTPGAPLPHIKRSDNNELLVTTLDPDATSRQDRTLEKPDAYLERALWIACWEMLRRGMSWEEVSDWCRRHHEGWRAISIGRGKNPEDVRSNAAWRNVCYLASQANNMMDYEAAVYGLLGGSVNAVQRICRNVDDTLYAHYNAALVQQFDQYLASYYPDRAAQGRRGRVEDALRDPGQQIVDLILRLRKQPETKKEAKQPLKIIQSYLLANDMNSMVNTLGYAIAYTDEQEVDPAESIILPLNPFWSEDGNLPEEEVALDPQALRIATHIALVMRALSEETLEGDARYAEENVIVAYIQALRMAGKRDLIPMYASRLSLGRQVVSMSRIIEDIKSPSEQQTVSSLFEHYNMDTIMIVNESLYWLLTKYVSPLLGSRRRFQMLEKVDDTRLYPGQRIQKGFLPQDIDEGEQVIVNTLQWYSMINGYWSDCFQALSTALRKCLGKSMYCSTSMYHG